MATNTYNRQEAYTFAYSNLLASRAVLRDLRDRCQLASESEEPCDVRLGFDGSLHWFDGDVSYDSYHTTHCAAASVSWDDVNSALQETARDLCDQIEESIAESEA